MTTEATSYEFVKHAWGRFPGKCTGRKRRMKHTEKPGASGKGGWGFLIFLILLILTAVFLRTPGPCSEPLTYRIGTVDMRFGMSRQEFAGAVRHASSIWEKALSLDLFRGVVEINLIYDYRQEAMDRLRNLSFVIDNTKNSYEDLRLRFENLKTEYERRSAALAADFNAYNSRVSAFNAEIASQRQQGGVPEHVYNRLMREKEELNALRNTLHVRREELKKTADTMNSLVVVINEIAANYNLDLVAYRDVGNRLGAEFYGGEYVSKNGKRSITIYQFDNYPRLVRVLAHELGHALGLNHNDNFQALMYRRNQSDSLELAPEDIAALKARCGSNAR